MRTTFIFLATKYTLSMHSNKVHTLSKLYKQYVLQIGLVIEDSITVIFSNIRLTPKQFLTQATYNLTGWGNWCWNTLGPLGLFLSDNVNDMYIVLVHLILINVDIFEWMHQRMASECRWHLHPVTHDLCRRGTTNVITTIPTLTNSYNWTNAPRNVSLTSPSCSRWYLERRHNNGFERW